MNLRLQAVGRVLRKEIREASRDRTMLVNLVLIPLFLYPVLGFGALQVFQIIQGVSEREISTVLVGEQVPEKVREALAAEDGLVVADVPPVLTLRAGEIPSRAEFRAYRQERVEAGEPGPDALLLWAPGSGGAGDTAWVFYDASRDRSSSARSLIDEKLDDWRRETALARIEEVGLGESDLDLWELTEENTASAAQRGQDVLAAILPITLLIMLTMGSMYAALDSVVGEKERGTLESILTAPLTRGEILTGKFLYVALASVFSLLLNLVSLSLFVRFALHLMLPEAEIEIEIGASAFLLIFIGALLSAGFFAALLMIAAATAQNYREGQAALMPFYLGALVPGMMASVTRAPFDLKQALIPVVNLVAMFKSVLKGEMPTVPIVVTFVVLAFLTVVMLALATRISAREDVYLETRVGLKNLLLGKGG
jgi:sodium transport system permease protein